MRNKKGFTLIELMIVVAIIAVLAAIAIPNFMTFMAKTKRAEVKYNLEAIYKCELSWYGEHDGFSNSFSEIRWRPDGVIYYYTFSLGSGTMGLDLSRNPMPGSALPAATDNSFAAYGWGSIDPDNGTDVWHIDDQKNLINDVDDLQL